MPGVQCTPNTSLWNIDVDDRGAKTQSSIGDFMHIDRSSFILCFSMSVVVCCLCHLSAWPETQPNNGDVLIVILNFLKILLILLFLLFFFLLLIPLLPS